MNHRFIFVFFLVFFSFANKGMDSKDYGPTEQLDNGMIVYSNYTEVFNDWEDEYYDYWGDEDYSSAKMLLAENWTNPVTNMVFAAKTYIESYLDGNLISGTLAEDWKEPNTGIVLKKGKTVSFNENGGFDYFTLARDWKHPELGYTLKAETIVNYYDNGRLCSFTIKDDFKLENGMIAKGGKEIRFNLDGSIHILTLAEKWQQPESDLIIKDNTIVSFWAGAKFYKYTPACDVTLPGTNMILKKDCEVKWKKDGTLMSATFAKPWTDPETGIEYEADKEYSFD